MRSSPPESVFDVLVRVLAPYLGANMARSIARGQCEKLKISGNTLDAKQLAALTEALRPGLRVFVGPESTERVLASVARACSETGDRDA